MTDPLDDIFSPERLRARWQDRKEDAATWKRDEPDTVPSSPENVMAVYNRLQTLIHERFKGEQGEALNVMMEELEDLLQKRFPPEAEVSEEDKAILNPSIEELLNGVEDLIEALEL
jgi:hypothetical protein